MNELIKTIFGDDSITFDEFVERLDGASPDEFFVDKADYDILTDSYNELKEKAESFDPDWESKARKIVFDGTLDCALNATTAKDKTLVKKLLELDLLEYENVKIKGLDEQIEQLKSRHDYLF